jgi:hypothetical protein
LYKWCMNLLFVWVLESARISPAVSPSFYFVAQYQIQLGSDDDTLSNSSREDVSTVSHIYLLQWESVIVPLAWLDSGFSPAMSSHSTLATQPKLDAWGKGVTR